MKTLSILYICISFFLAIILPAQAQNVGNWKVVGPVVFPINNSGQIHGIGRISQVKFHPSNNQKMYAISASGGLFISTDGSQTWKPTGTDNLFRTNSASICVDYTNDQVLYLGTGDANYYSTYYGIYKSTDGGATWNAANAGIGNRMALEILMSPSDHNVLLAATNDGIWKSTNGGSSWSVTKSGGDFTEMVFKPGDPNTVYAATHTQLFRSNDMGNSWVLVSLPGTGFQNGGRIGVSKADPNVVYVTFVGDFSSGIAAPVLKSTNSGVSFSVTKAANTLNLNGYDGGSNGQGNYNYAITVDPNNANTVYIASHVVWKSTDGGVNWSQLTNWYQKVHTDMHQIIVSPYDNTKLFNMNDGGVWLSTDGGNNWTPKSDGLACSEIYHAAQSPIRKDMIDIGTQDNGELNYVNNTWYTNGGGDFGGHISFDYQDNTDVYHLGSDRSRKRLTGGGSPPSLTFPFAAGDGNGNDVEIEFSALQTQLGFVAQNEVYRTTNLSSGPPSWTQITNINTQVKALGSSPADANILYVVTNNNKLYRSDNALSATPTFTTLNTPGATNVRTSIAGIKSNSSVVYMTCGSKVYRSADKGASWSDISTGLPNVNIIKIIHDTHSNDESVYIGMATGVYFKNNTLNTWINYSQGLPTVCNINEIMIFNDGTVNSELRIGYFGRGVWGASLYSNLSTPLISITSPLNGDIFTPGNNIMLNATASASSGKTVSKVEFYNGTTLLGTSTASPYTFNWTNVPAGTYNLTAKVYDNTNANSVSTVVTINVSYVGTTVFQDCNYSTGGYSVSLIAGNYTLAQLQAKGIANDDISSVKVVAGYKVVLYKDDNFQGDSLVLTADNSCLVSNNWNDAASSLKVTKIVTNKAPTVSITAPTNNASYIQTSTITLTATAADVDGTVAKVEFYNGTTLIGKSTNTTSPYSFAWTNVAAGSYSLTAIATDNSGASTTSSIINITVTPLRTPENPSTAVSGLDYSYYEGNWNALPDFTTLTPVKSGTSTTGFDLGLRNRDTQFGFVYTGYISVPTDGIYTLYTSSDDGSNLFIGNTQVVANDGLHGTQEKSGVIGLKAGKHAITVNFFQQGGGEVLTVSYDGPGIAKQTVPTSVLFKKNISPTVSITAPTNNASYIQTSIITLTANAADADGSVAKVEFYNGTTLIGKSANTASPYNFIWTNAVAGTYPITAVATDNSGATTTSSVVNITVTPLRTPENPSTAVSGLDYSYYEGSWSALPNFTTLTPVKSGISTTGFDIGLRNRDDQFGFVFKGYINVPTDGIYTLYTSSDDGSNLFIGNTQLVANDGLHGTQEQSGVIGLKAGKHAITVNFFEQGGDQVLTVSYQGPGIAKQIVPNGSLYRNNSGNVNPTVSLTAPANNASYTAPANISITANASDADGSISKVEFYNGSTLLGTDNSSPYTYAWNSVAVGTYTIKVIAYDNLNATATTSINVTVNPPANVAPTVSITAPANNASYTAPANISIAANASDSDGSISKVEFYNGSTLLGTDNSSPYTYAWNSVAVGTYTIKVIAYDNLNATATASVNVTVNPPANVAPTVSITAPANNASYTAPANISIAANASDSDGSISKVEFYSGSTLLGTSSSSPYSFAWNSVAAGTYTIKVIAYDNLNATATASINVTVTGSVSACTGVATYTENSGYVPGSRTQNAGSLYQCKPWPYSGWCNGAAWAYAPGTGMYWTDAWDLVGSCNAPVKASMESAKLAVTNSPNPFESRTLIQFDLDQEGTVNITLYDMQGVKVADIFNGNLKVGPNSVEIDSYTHQLADGMYVCRVQTADKAVSMNIMKATRPKAVMK